MTTAEKIRGFIKQNVGYIVIVLVSAVYVSTALITIDETGKTVGQIIVDSVLAFLLGFSINRIFDIQGLINGDRDERMYKAREAHEAAVIKISPGIDRLGDWCELRNKENLAVQRAKILSNAGLSYNDCFDDEGRPKPYDVDRKKLKDRIFGRMERRKLRAFKKAVYLKLTPLTASLLTGEGAHSDDPFNFGRTKKQYETQQSVSDALTKIVIALIVGYYAVKPLSDFSYAALIWNAIQVGIYTLIGVIKMFNSFIFVTEEFRGRIVEKTNNLEMFYVYINKQRPDTGKGEDNVDKEQL